MPGDLSADQQRLDEFGAFIGVHHFHICQVPGDMEVQQQAVAAHQVPGLVGDGAGLVGRVHFGDRGHGAGPRSLSCSSAMR